VTTGHFRQARIRVAVSLLALIAALGPARAQSEEPAGGGSVQGYVRDFGGKPVGNATVFAQLATETETPTEPAEITHTDADGAYRFVTLREGAYTLRAESDGQSGATVGPVRLRPKENKQVDLVVTSVKTSEPQTARPSTAAAKTPAAEPPQFFDEPQFTVAGVTQAANSGGHGSDTVLRTTEALAKATVSLSKDSSTSSTVAGSVATENSLRGAATREPENFAANRSLGKFLADHERAVEAVPFLQRASRLNPKDPESHHLLGDVEEKIGNPLEAVREYQRAAELDPSEPDLFDWGTELLTHRALEPATEVFTKGNRLFPKSVRMLIALGVAWYARGSYDQAAQYLVNASDLDPDNPAPYLFLGKMQSVEATPSAGSVTTLARFAQLEPNNALANYYYAVSLYKQSAGSEDSDGERSRRAETSLLNAVHLDPKLAAAYLQLGILYSQRADFSRAISAYQKAIEVSAQQLSPEFDDTVEQTHYRLAQAYLRTGDKIKSKEQLKLHAELAKKTKEDTEHSRRDIQEFVISLQNRGDGRQ
jgi:tetratricopeptide (TPR) repeat protein